MQPTLELKRIEEEIIFRNPEILMQADLNLLEQVFINLTLNVMEAVKEKYKKTVA